MSVQRLQELQEIAFQKAQGNATAVKAPIVAPAPQPVVMNTEAVRTMISNIQELNKTAVVPIAIPKIQQNIAKPDEFLVTPKLTTVILPSQPEQFIFQSGGLNAATKSDPLIAPIKPVYAEPILDIPELVHPAIEMPMPKVSSQPESVIQPVVQTVVQPVKKLGILDQLTNYIYKLIYKK
jgi:hypothetical protein